MSPGEARSCLEEVEGYLSAAIQELIQMNPSLAWQPPLKNASDLLLKLKGLPADPDGTLGRLMDEVRIQTERVRQLLDSAASFLYGCMSSACPPSTEYTAGGEIADWREAGVVQTHG